MPIIDGNRAIEHKPTSQDIKKTLELLDATRCPDNGMFELASLDDGRKVYLELRDGACQYWAVKF